jgi:creatinine amidohydrolase/Fe(II)-dependent formamide hydrolase-like protein
MCTSLMLACNATLWAQILDVRELNTEQIDRLDRTRTAVLLTAGILEQHGPFLPSYSDGYQSEFLAARRRRSCCPIWMDGPSVPGDSPRHIPG